MDIDIALESLKNIFTSMSPHMKQKDAPEDAEIDSLRKIF